MGIIPKLKKPLESLTVQDQERAMRNLRGETEELLSTIGDESDEKAVPATQEYVKELSEEEQNRLQADQEALTYYSRNKKTYQRYLVLVLERFVKEEDIPNNYSITVESTDEGISLHLDNTEYYGAFKVIGIPTYDINACKVTAVQLGNTVSRLEGHFPTTDSGIIIASEAEANIAKRIWNSKNKRRK